MTGGGDPEFPFDDMFPQQDYDTPTEAEIEEAERMLEHHGLPEEGAAEGATEGAAEVAAEGAADVGAEAAVEGGLVVVEEAAAATGPIGWAVAGGIALGAAAGEALWEFDREYLSAGSHMEDVEDPPAE
jgi:hypothetical protein